MQICIGIATLDRFPEGLPPRAADLMRDAAVALSHAKRDRALPYCVYSAEMAEQSQRRVTMLNELRAALDFHRGLLLHYQPQIDAERGVVLGVEALIRWRQADGGMVPPDSFIPLAEYTGLIVEIGAWVFRTACEQLIDWRSAGQSGLRMAVNVSALQFRQDGFVAMIRKVLSETGADPRQIELEVTESVAMEDIDKVIRQLSELKALGISISLDDFGCGYSSLNSLARLPIDRLKIDRSFVAQLSSSNAREGIVQTIIRLADGSGMAVIAEGVETAEQSELLRELGCHEMQGYFYGRPMPAEALTEWCQRFRTAD